MMHDDIIVKLFDINNHRMMEPIIPHQLFISDVVSVKDSIDIMTENVASYGTLVKPPILVAPPTVDGMTASFKIIAFVLVHKPGYYDNLSVVIKPTGLGASTLINTSLKSVNVKLCVEANSYRRDGKVIIREINSVNYAVSER